jgi:hypothetical protein
MDDLDGSGACGGQLAEGRSYSQCGKSRWHLSIDSASDRRILQKAVSIQWYDAPRPDSRFMIRIMLPDGSLA